MVQSYVYMCELSILLYFVHTHRVLDYYGSDVNSGYHCALKFQMSAFFLFLMLICDIHY